MTIVISGSMAYDRIMDFPGYFADHILPEKIRMINLSFTVNGMVEKFGGTAGNIAYALSLFGEKPLIVATVGHDYQPYFEWLVKNHLPTDYMKIIPEETTAGAYITTDRADNQITGFNPGAMKHKSAFDFASLVPGKSIAIIAPGNLDDMMDYSMACRKRGIPYIFDPGQSLPAWKPEELQSCIRGARLLISNDYELELIMDKTGIKREKLLEMAVAVITTLGENGSRISMKGGDIAIPAVKPDKVVDPTGCGDAYRGALIYGLVHSKPLAEAALMGSVAASFCIEVYGTQEYHFTPEEFNARLKECAPIHE
jgi:adenosine kinase